MLFHWLKIHFQMQDGELFVAPHERRHYIFIRFWKVPIEVAVLFAGL